MSFMRKPASPTASYDFPEHCMNEMTSIRAVEPWNGRVEDDALLRGTGKFGDDVKPDGALSAAFVRSPHGYAKIVSIDVSAAKSAKGVAGVFTAADLAAAHYHSVSHPHPLPFYQGPPIFAPDRPVLAHDIVRHVGEPVAIVLARTAAQALDA